MDAQQPAAGAKGAGKGKGRGRGAPALAALPAPAGAARPASAPVAAGPPRLGTLGTFSAIQPPAQGRLGTIGPSVDAGAAGEKKARFVPTVPVRRKKDGTGPSEPPASSSNIDSLLAGPIPVLLQDAARTDSGEGRGRFKPRTSQMGNQQKGKFVAGLGSGGAAGRGGPLPLNAAFGSKGIAVRRLGPGAAKAAQEEEENDEFVGGVYQPMALPLLDPKARRKKEAGRRAKQAAGREVKTEPMEEEGVPVAVAVKVEEEGVPVAVAVKVEGEGSEGAGRGLGRKREKREDAEGGLSMEHDEDEDDEEDDEEEEEEAAAGDEPEAARGERGPGAPPGEAEGEEEEDLGRFLARHLGEGDAAEDRIFFVQLPSHLPIAPARLAAPAPPPAVKQEPADEAAEAAAKPDGPDAAPKALPAPPAAPGAPGPSAGPSAGPSGAGAAPALAPSVKLEPGASTASASSAAGAIPGAGGGGEVPPIMNVGQLPSGVAGKLLLHRSGRVRLRLGDITYDVAEGSRCTFMQQAAACAPGTGQCFILGDIGRRIVCSPDMDSLLSHL
eukprot:tig00001086_g6863.t1